MLIRIWIHDGIFIQYRYNTLQQIIEAFIDDGYALSDIIRVERVSAPVVPS